MFWQSPIVSSFKDMHKHKLRGGRVFFFLNKSQQNFQYKYQQPNIPCKKANFNKEINIKDNLFNIEYPSKR